MSLIILDDVFPEKCFKEIQKHQLEPKENEDKERWFLLDTEHSSKNLAKSLIKIASKYYSLDFYTGYESWHHRNTRPPTWHIDNDERRRAEDGILSFPECSIIYYIYVNNLIGGQLYVSHNNDLGGGSNDLYEEIRADGRLDNQVADVVTPKNNRMVIMPPGVFHTVSHFTGERAVIAVNPWYATKWKYPDIVHADS